MNMTIAVIDGMGGGIGTEIVTQLRKELGADAVIIALGINAVATDRMMQVKASRGASGENAIRCSIDAADFVIGPIGIVLPNGLMGEVTKEIAEIVMNSRGKKILIPVYHHKIKIAGLEKDRQLSVLINEAVGEVKKMAEEN